MKTSQVSLKVVLNERTRDDLVTQSFQIPLGKITYTIVIIKVKINAKQLHLYIICILITSFNEKEIQ